MDQNHTKGKGIRLLSLDGGGRGSVSQIRIIEEFITRLAYDLGVDVDSVFPADLFDLIAGVGFGGYVALLIGPLRMTASQAMDELITLGTRVFADGQEDSTPEENSRRLREAVEDLLRRHELPLDIKLRDQRLLGSSSCKTVVLATPCLDATQCYLFRTYPSREQSIDCTFVEAACATLSIPSAFSPVSIGPRPRQRAFSSATFGFNNPTKELLREAERLFGRDAPVSVILSLGSGRPGALTLDNSTSTHQALQRQIIVDCETTARELSSQLFEMDSYLRLNVDRGMEGIDIDNWMDLGAIEGHTDSYLHTQTATKAIDSTLQRLRENVGSVSLGTLNRSTAIKLQAKRTPAVSPYFVMRKEYWDAMEKHLVSSPETNRKILVLSGMGGCGKTQMISFFVQQYHNLYKHIFFIDASSNSSIRSDLQAAIRSLGVAYEQMTFEDAITFLVNGQHDGKWLLVLDNADDPKIDLASYLPSCYHGTILVSTRNPELGRLNTTAHLQLGPMGDEEALEILLRAAHRRFPFSPEEEASAKQLIGELGGLAVALVQAGNYCYCMSSTANSNDGFYTFGQYLSLFENQRAELMKKADKVSLDRYGRGAYTTFELSYSALTQSARDFLHLCSFFHYTDISLEMLKSAVECGYDDFECYVAKTELHREARDRLKKLLSPAGQWDELHIHDIIHSLQSFSLVSTTSASNTILLRFHPLVHRFSRDIISVGDTEPYRQMAIQVAASCATQDLIPLYRFLLPHIMSLIEGTSISYIHINDQMAVGRVLLELGDLSKATELMLDARNNIQKQLGTEHMLTVTASSRLAIAYRKQGRWDDATKIQVDMLEQRQRLLGNDHEETIAAASHLALTLSAHGKHQEAAVLTLDVLERRQKLLGHDHLETILAAQNLSVIYREQGKLEEAEAIAKDVLDQRHLLLGQDHQDTILAASHLAVIYNKQGRLEEAEQLGLRVLMHQQTLLGEDHPKTLRAAANLAGTYSKLMRLKEAEEIEATVLEKRKRILGKEHPHTLWNAANLAATYRRQGRLLEAERLLVDTLEAGERVLGLEHPSTRRYAMDLSSLRTERSSSEQQPSSTGSQSSVVQPPVALTMGFGHVFQLIRYIFR